jgi:cupin 2 domain-containing protein
MSARPRNLLAPVAGALREELVEELLRAPGARLERIVSRGHRTPDGRWYDQGWDEWVLVLAGRARLRVAGEAAPVALAPGDSLLLRAHVRHRVEWTDPDADTVWLALHLGPVAGGQT